MARCAKCGNFFAGDSCPFCEPRFPSQIPLKDVPDWWNDPSLDIEEIWREKNVDDKLPLIKVTNMGNITVENSNNVQVIVGIGNKQVQVSKELQPKLEKEIIKKTPMSPIELFFQEKQDTFNELAKKFSTYLNRPSVITKDVIKGWLLHWSSLKTTIRP